MIPSIIDTDTIDSPALIVFPDIIKKNIQLAIRMTGDVNRLRPHVKTHKNPQVTQLMLDAGITKFKCATIAEAEMLALAKAPDVLLAYPLMGPKTRRFIELVKAFPETKFSCLIDNISTAQHAEDAFGKERLTIDVYLDLNIGMNRTGIEPGQEALDLYGYLHQSKVLRLQGLHAYDGHVRHAEIAERKKICDAGFDPVYVLRDQALGAGLAVNNIIAGGSPTFPVHAQRQDVECSPGTFVYWDRGYQLGCPEQAFEPAAILLTRVISNPSEGTWCLDLGHKSVAAESEISKRVYLPELARYTPVSQSEEHLVLTAPPSNHRPPQQGDVVFGIPWHVCPTVALYERVICVEKGKVTGEWENWARDRKRRF